MKEGGRIASNFFLFLPRYGLGVKPLHVTATALMDFPRLLTLLSDASTSTFCWSSMSKSFGVGDTGPAGGAKTFRSVDADNSTTREGDGENGTSRHDDDEQSRLSVVDDAVDEEYDAGRAPEESETEVEDDEEMEVLVDEQGTVRLEVKNDRNCSFCRLFILLSRSAFSSLYVPK